MFLELIKEKQKIKLGNQELVNDSCLCFDLFQVEIWKEHESTLKVSNMCRIKYPTGRLTTPFINNNGYKQLIFKNKILLYHRLIASLFVKNYNNYFNIKHLDGDRLNNNFENLKWVKTNNEILL